MIGRTIAHYEVLDKLGEGGMGVVYKARDVRLGRLVALKFLPEEATRDPERRRRFSDEARAASALNHPGIVTIYDIASDGGQDFIAMEFVPGVTIEQRLAGRAGKGLSLRDVLGYAIQIADALAAAHTAGIVHRDLKPGNVIVSETGAVKVLDFGLAKLVEAEPAPADATTGLQSATGLIAGTVSYMSPEQAEGRLVDHRSDIFSFGTMLYEMVSGRRPFTGETPMATLLAITRGETPSISQDLLGAPPELRRIVGRCLRKDRDRRFQHMDDLEVALADVRDELHTAAAGTVLENAADRPAITTRGLWLWVGVAAIVAGLGGALAASRWNAAPAVDGPPQLTRLTSDDGLTNEPALSPDGKLLAYASDRASTPEGGLNTDLWVQQVAGGEPIRLTRDPADEHEPGFSPDGSRIVFRSDKDGGSLYVISALGGQPRLLVKGGHYPQWSPDGASIAYWDGEPASGILTTAGDTRIFIVPADGGTPRTFHPDFSMAFPPIWAPDSKHLLFWGRRTTEDADWWAAPLKGEPVATGAAVRLAQPGLVQGATLVSAITGSHELVLSAGLSLWRLPLDAATWRARTSPSLLTYGTVTHIHPAASRDGAVAFYSGTTEVNVWSVPIDANGARALGPAVKHTSGAAAHTRPAVSADGRMIAFSSNRSGTPDAWIKDLDTGVERVVAGSNGVDDYAVFSPDGSRVAYSRRNSPNERSSLYVVPTAGGVAERLCDGCGAWNQWAPGGDGIVTMGPGTAAGTFVTKFVDLKGRERWTVAHSQFNAFGPRLSPDRRWLAVSVNQGQGRAAVWLAPMSDTGAGPESMWIRITGDTAFADKQDWSPDGNVLYYYSTQDGFGCLYAQRLEPTTKRPVGPPIGISHWHGARRSLHNVGFGLLNVAVSKNRIVFNLSEQTGNIWLLRRREPTN